MGMEGIGARVARKEDKRFITGKGNASKDAVSSAIAELGHCPVDDNEADALALLHWAINAAIGGSDG